MNYSNYWKPLALAFAISGAAACQSGGGGEEKQAEKAPQEKVDKGFDSRKYTASPADLMKKYVQVPLSTDLSHLSQDQIRLLGHLYDAADVMDELFWRQAFTEKDRFLQDIDDDLMRTFASINYGPWDRLDGNRPFIKQFGEKPKGANFYPADMKVEEFEKSKAEDKDGLYTMIRRGDDGKIESIPYSRYFTKALNEAANHLKEAAKLAEDEGFKKYLNERAEALLNDDYDQSDRTWLDMRDNDIDIVIGPIENYEDRLFGYKAAFEAFILIKDQEWSEKLEKYSALLPELQKNLPVDDTYKAEKPGSDGQLYVYDAIYYAGDCNAGSKTIAINLPNDENIQLEKGTRRLQLKNTMKAKYDRILTPIANELIDPDQVNMIHFDAFFDNVMFHEVAHGLGIKNTINDRGTVRKALGDQHAALEEGKADILGLFMIHQLNEMGEIDVDMNSYYVTFMAGIFRSVRFGVASAHGRANILRFNFFQEKNAFERDEATGKYKVNFDKMEAAMNELSQIILTLQGDGNRGAVEKLMEEYGSIQSPLKEDLQRLEEGGIPVDIYFDQGKSLLSKFIEEGEEL